MADYDTSNLERSKPGETREKQNGPSHPAGVYKHPQTGAEVITLEDPLYGNAQSEAFARVGFVRVRDAKPEEIKTLPALAFERKERVEMDSGDTAARLAKIELEQAREKAARLEKELAEARAQTSNKTEGVTSESVAKDANQDTGDSKQGYQEKTDKKGNVYHVGPDGKRVSKEEYNQNVNKKGE